MRHALLAATAAVVLLGSSSAQTPVLELTGVIEKAPPSPCDPRATHQVKCTDVLLFGSAGIDLSQWEGRAADLQFQVSSLAGCTVLEVTGIQAASSSTTVFSLLGYRLGSTVLITTLAPIGSVVGYVFAEAPGFVPVPLQGVGSYLLDPGSSLFWTTDLSIGVALRTLPIPSCPELVGVTARMQTFAFSVTPALGVRLLNSSCFTVR